MSNINLPDRKYTAVVDTVEDWLATVFFERDSKEVGNAVLELTTPVEEQHADAVLSVTLCGGHNEATSYESEQTTTRVEAAQDQFERSRSGHRLIGSRS